MNSLTRETREADRGQAEQFITPPASVTEIADGYMLEIEMPGVKKDGLDISVENNELTIVGRRSLPTVEGTLVHRESRPEISGACSSSIHQSMATKSAQKSTRAW